MKELSQALLLQGRALLNARRFEDALNRFSEQRQVAAKVSPEDEAKGWEGVGLVYEAEENFPAAALQFGRAAELAGKNRDAQYYQIETARVQTELGRLQEAEALLKLLSAADSTAALRSEIRSLMAEIHLLSGSPARVQEDLGATVSQDTSVRVLLGRADLLNRRFVGAAAKCRAALTDTIAAKDVDGIATSSVCIAEALLGAGSPRLSLEVLARYQALWSTSPVERWRALAIRSACLLALGRRDEAEESRKAAGSVVRDLIALWGARDFELYRNRADVRGSRMMMNTLMEKKNER